MMTFGKHYSPPREESTQRLHSVKANHDLWETLSLSGVLVKIEREFPFQAASWKSRPSVL